LRELVLTLPKSGRQLDDRNESGMLSSQLGQTIRVAYRGRIG
jgi:hypothetical protein